MPASCMSAHKAPVHGPALPPTGWAARIPPSQTRSSCWGACVPARWPVAPSISTVRLLAGQSKPSWPSRSASRLRTLPPASSVCWSRTCCMPSNGSASSAATIRRRSLSSLPAAPDRCTARPWRARWGADAPCSRALPARSAPWACCSRMSARTICRSSWPISTRSNPSALEEGFAEIEARAREALLRDGFERMKRPRPSGRSIFATTASSGRYACPSAPRASTPPPRAEPSRAEHQRLFGHIQPGGRIDITALRIVGRGRLDWTPAAARSPQSAPPKPRETRKVWIDPDTWLARRAGLRRRRPATGLQPRRPLADRGAHHDGLRRSDAIVLEVDERDDFLVRVGSASPPHSNGEVPASARAEGS
jgi:hypothetical protein